MLLRYSGRRAAAAASWFNGRVPACTSMPLRAKIMNPASWAQAPASTRAEPPKELPGDEPDDVLFNTLYGIRTIELNRPRKLNALNGSMARKIVPRLMEWEKSQMANIIIIKGRGDKAFCAGGDVAALVQLCADEGAAGLQKSREYFALEYQLDHLIATYSKPYVAFMDGITMGGGAGLCVHAPFRIATERTLFAMPETAIGFFPDVGAGFFLPRLDGQLGMYLALTSERLTGVNTYYAGVATHYLHSSSLPDLEGRLAELTFRDYDSLEERYRIIDSTIEEYTTGLPHDQPMQPAGAIRAAIDRCFSQPSIAAVLAALEAEANQADPAADDPSSSSSSSAHETSAWAHQTLDTLLHVRAPTSVRVAFRQMNIGRRWSLAETFQREYVLATKFLEDPDFAAGVRAALIDRAAGPPRWQAPPLTDPTPDHEHGPTDALLSITPGSPRLPLLRTTTSTTNTDYTDYPHRWIGLPTERDIETLIKDPHGPTIVAEFLNPALTPTRTATSHHPPPLTRAKILRYFTALKEDKLGTLEKVREVLLRKTRVVSSSAAAVEEDDGHGDALDAAQIEGEGEGEGHGNGKGNGDGQRCIWID